MILGTLAGLVILVVALTAVIGHQWLELRRWRIVRMELELMAIRNDRGLASCAEKHDPQETWEEGFHEGVSSALSTIFCKLPR